MMIKVYVDFEGERVFNEQDYLDFIEELVEDREEYDELLSDFLNYENDFTSAEIFRLSQEEKAELLTRYKDYVRNYIKENDLSRCGEYEIEI